MIESMPEADSIIVIWFKLLCLAGKQNNSGVFQMGHMPYTDEMFSTIFRRPLNTVRMALRTFEQFAMIEIINNTVTIPHWDKHQSLDVYEKKKERDRLYQAERRASQKRLAEKSSDNRLTSCDSSSYVVVSDKKRLEEIKSDIEEEKNIFEDKPPKATRHKYGNYMNVLLSDEEYEKLQNEFPNDYTDRIERLSEYIASTGKKYKNYLATIRSWARKDSDKPSGPKGSSSNPFIDLLREEGGI